MHCATPAVLLLLLSFTAGCREGADKYNPSPNHMNPPVHPGQIVFINDGDHSRKTKPISEVPESKHFVYLLKGVETHDREKADEAVPILEVQMTPLDAAGKVTIPANAVTVIIKESGPNGRLLRHTTMKKN